MLQILARTDSLQIFSASICPIARTQTRNLVYFNRGKSTGKKASDHISSRIPLKNGCRTFPLSGLGAVLDFGQQFGFDPDAVVCDALAVGLGLADERREPLAQ